MSQLSTADDGRIDRDWWKEAVVYQIYPRSFNDSDGDGVGDLPGITERVDYLADLGVDVVWLCPVYDSPNEDNGYDIRDYRAIADEFGDMADWEELLAALHDRGIRLIMDLVVNHTSSEHEWFQRSRRGEDGYADYYHWVEGSPDEPPNNWESLFGGPAWSYDDERGAWYLHVFDEHQPDLNWRNPAVREEVRDVVSWWLEKGIDGFRMDAISHMSKPEGYPDGDPDADIVGADRYTHGPRLTEYLADMATVLPEDVMTVGEMGGTTAAQAAEYLRADTGLDTVFHFDHLDVDTGEGGWTDDEWGEWDLSEFKRVLTHNQREVAADAWDALFLGNHDQPRIVSRFGGDGEYRRPSAKLLGTFLLTMRGTPYVYQGQELGMTNAEFESLEEIDDVKTVGLVEELLADGEIDSFEDVRDVVNHRSRDHARTPMQWADADGAGFTDGDPWLTLNENHDEINVAAARADPDSVFHHYRRLIELRHGDPVLVYGDYDLLCPDDEQIYAYTRALDGDRRLVVLNWSEEPATFALDDGDLDDLARADSDLDDLARADSDPDDLPRAGADALLGNYDDPPADPVGARFRPYEAVVYEL